MKKSTKIVLFTGLGLLCAGIVICVLVFVLNGFRLTPAADSKKTAGGEPETFERIVSDPFDAIEIKAASANVEIQPSSPDKQCRIRFEKVYGASDYETQVNGGTLIIKNTQDDSGWDWKNPAQLLEHIFGSIGDGFSENGKLILYLPEDTYRQLNIATASGDISSDMQLKAAEVNLASASGDIRTGNLKDTETVNIATASGKIEVSDFSARSALNLESISGDIQIASCNKDVPGEKTHSFMDITSTSGKILLTDAVFASGKLKTVSGDIKLENAESETMEIETTSGEVTGRIGSTYHVEVSTVSGDVNVPSGTRGNWHIKTVSGDVNLN